jgi:hypothetical protein
MSGGLPTEPDYHDIREAASLALAEIDRLTMKLRRLLDPEFATELAEAREQVEAGKVRAWEDIKAEGIRRQEAHDERIRAESALLTPSEPAPTPKEGAL